MNRKCDDDDGNCNNKKLKSEDIEEDETEVDLNDEEERLVINGESNYGICERVNSTGKRFKAQLKEFAADFIVNEIDLQGKVVRLTDIGEQQLDTYKSMFNESCESKEEYVEKLRTIIGDEKLSALITYLNEEVNKSSSKPFLLLAPVNKDDRKRVHDFLKKHFKSFESNTRNLGNEDEKKLLLANDSTVNVIEITRSRRPIRSESYYDKFKVSECSLYKENIDTIQAVNIIAKHLRITTKRIGFAGTKDKKAKTTQSISIFKIDPKRILALNNQLTNIKLGNIKLTNEDGFRLGDLSGNRFKIVLRQVVAFNGDNEVISEQINHLKANGFINYFGLQRFGNSTQVPTHSIGKCLIQNKLKEAIELILKPRNDLCERSEIKLARDVWFNNNNDAYQALMHIERINCVEKFILNGLTKLGASDYLGAFQFLPRNMRLMYLHAYQSFIWNWAASKRIETFGYRVELGDLVRNRMGESKRCKNQRLKLNNKNNNQQISEEEEVVYVTEVNISNFDIYDVVLPMPGFDVVYPKNSMKAYYEEILMKDGIGLDGFRNKIKDFSLSGDYRNVVTKPGDLEYTIVNYTDKDKQLTRSDWELLANPESGEKEKTTTVGGDYKAIIIEFNLPSSSYATMALREILENN